MKQQYIDEILSRVSVPGYTLHARIVYQYFTLWATYVEPDIETGVPAIQRTRDWLIHASDTEHQIVQTALKCVLTSAEHRIREAFTYKGQRIFGPHYDLDELVMLCEAKSEKVSA